MALFSDRDLNKVFNESDTYIEANQIENDDIQPLKMLSFKEDFDYKSVYRSPEFEQIMTEYFDITDNETRHVLLSVNEADQNKILVSLTSKLYDNVVAKVTDIDFGDVPDSKGDITKIPNYEKLKDSVRIMSDILKEYKQDSEPVDAINTAINNIIDRRELFEKAFRYKVELPMIMYNTIVLAVISSISYMISTCIEFVKMPNADDFKMTLDSVRLVKTRDHMLFVNLKKFNNACNSGELDKALDFVIKSNVKNLTGGAIGLIAGGAAVITIIFNIIPIIRELIFLFFYSRTRVSDYFEVQANLLQMNAQNIEANSSKDKKEKDTIAKKQNSIATFFKKIANAIAIKGKESEVKATKDIVNSNKKYTTSEIMDEMPDSASSALF